jgi:hypothetical protein
VAGSCEYDNELLGSVKGGEFLHYLSDYWLLKEDSDGVGWLFVAKKYEGTLVILIL